MTSAKPPGSSEGASGSSRAGPLAKGVVVTAIVLPFAALATCSSTIQANGNLGGVGWGLGLFGLGLVAGLAVLMMFINGKARALTGVGFGLNAAGVIANVAYFISQLHYTRGRQIAGPGGRVLPVRRPEPPPGTLRALAGRAWRNNGDTEAASVSAFSLLSLDLAQLGAPLALSRAAHEDALDEIRHAELCYRLARTCGDPDAGLAPMPGLAAVRGRDCTLARLAAESFIEGAYLEAVSAAIAAALRSNVDDQEVATVLGVIAADEARHAEHAWAVVSFCLETDRVAAGAALGEAMALLTAPDPRHDEPGSDGSLERLGIPGQYLQRSIATRCLAESKARLARLLAERPVGVRFPEPVGQAPGPRMG